MENARAMPIWADIELAHAHANWPDGLRIWVIKIGKGSVALTDKPLRVALMWSGDREARSGADLKQSRFSGLADTLRAAGVEAVPAVYHDDFADEVHDQLLGVDGVLVWVNPIEGGRGRTVLDSLLREVAEKGVFVSAHPDTIQKMGTKEVLYRTRNMTWGCDTRLYLSPKELREQLPLRLDEGTPRVLKQHRGNGGNGVWKVERHPSVSALVRVRHALRGSMEQDVPISDFFTQCEGYFAGEGRIIDQAYQERLADGMIRCYLVRDKVVGFGRQAINALYPAPHGADPADAPQPGPRLYYPPWMPQFQSIKTKMEEEWLGALCHTLEMNAESLPMIWDADFLYGPRIAAIEDTYVLCEINVSSVYPFPNEAIEPLASETKQILSTRNLSMSQKVF